ncbi:DUF47 domain-containing protein [Desulfurococcus amylolyticus]|uniref:Putative phosphate transport regulator n=1 Tax=Desulfurococcus amylolyticus DSM 16532 TaxID=768672 RepID=I3XS28_DESAM|nr:DUF47 family protein [Desulfurococcus amylolyticus]AFL66752.1 putative phosphate transport regulator [Desulfurococcus amylolyticus DSM 16532]
MSLPRGRYFEAILSSVIEHAKIVNKGMSKLVELVSNIPSGVDAVSTLYNELNSIEEKGDELKKEMIKELKAAYLHPEDRENILRFVLSLDEALGFAKAAGKRILLVLESGVPIQEGIQVLMKEIADKSLEASFKILELFEAINKDPRKALEITHEIEFLEKKIDELRLEAVGKIYLYCSKEVKPECIVIPPIIEDLEGISDVFENIADIYRLFTISR